MQNAEDSPSHKPYFHPSIVWVKQIIWKTCKMQKILPFTSLPLPPPPRPPTQEKAFYIKKTIDSIEGQVANHFPCFSQMVTTKIKSPSPSWGRLPLKNTWAILSFFSGFGIQYVYNNYVHCSFTNISMYVCRYRDSNISFTFMYISMYIHIP